MRKGIVVIVISVVLALFGAGWAFADACYDVWDKAEKAEALGKKAEGAGKYGDAVRHFSDAARYYGQVGKMQGCECPKIAKSGRHNAALYAERAERAKGKQEYAKFEDRFNKGRAYYEKGHAYAKKGRYAEAVKAFSLAEQSYKNASGFAEGKNKKAARENAAKSAKYAALAKSRMR